MKNVFKALTLAAIASTFAGVACAEDTVTGKWKGEFDSQIGVQKYIFDLKADGNKLTGKAIGERTMGTNEVSITEGRVGTNEIFFVEPLKFDDIELRIEYKGTITDEGLKLHRKVGDVAEEDFIAKRVKESESKPETKPEAKPVTKPEAKPAEKSTPARP